MKRHLLFILFLFLSFVVQAKEVTEQQAREVAVQFISNRAKGAVDITTINAIGHNQNAYYVINLMPQGWIIVAGDDVVKPIIGYSFQGNLSANSLPDNMKYMLDNYEQEIEQIAKKVKAQHPQWTSSKILTRASATEIAPLIKVNWNQDAPYNKYCPQSKALVGCVAVAMGQAMSVHRFPSRAVGKASYTSPNYGGLSINYDNELAYNWNDIHSAARNYDEVARLLYHAGLSVKMDYGVDASGIPSNEVNRISDALKSNFSYPPSVDYVWKDNYRGDWEQLLINELSAGRPIIYNAIDTKRSSGHSFNLDGYDGNEHFHINWGWGGSGNGNFLITNLRDGSMNYDAGHVAIIGIGIPDQKLKSISVTHERIEEKLPVGAVVGAILVNGKEPEANYKIKVHGSRTQDGYKSVPFIIENGMLKTTEILSADKPQWEIEITVEDEESGSVLTQGFRVIVEEWKSLEKTTSLQFDRQSRALTLTTKHNVTYSISNSTGAIIQAGSLIPLPQLVLDAKSLPAEKCTIELRCADESKTIQIIPN